MKQKKDKRSVDDILGESPQDSGEEPNWMPRTQSPAKKAVKPAKKQRRERQIIEHPQKRVDEWGPDLNVPAPSMESASGKIGGDVEQFTRRSNAPDESIMDFMSGMIDDHPSQPHVTPQPIKTKISSLQTQLSAPVDSSQLPEEYKSDIDGPPDDLLEAMALRVDENEDIQETINRGSQEKNGAYDPLIEFDEKATVDDILQKQPGPSPFTETSVTNAIIANIPRMTENKARWLAKVIIEAHEGK